MTVFEGQASGRWLGHDGGSLMSDVSILIKEVPGRSLAF